MPIVTLVVGGLLTRVGILGFTLSETHGVTALIPGVFGVLIETCGGLALLPQFKKHAMHGASARALLGVARVA